MTRIGGRIVPKRIEPRKKYICKICKVQVISATNTKAVWGKEHKDCCPRKNK